MSAYPLVPLGEVLRLNVDAVEVDAATEYPIAGVYSFGRGLFGRAPLPGTATTYKVFHRLHRDDFVLSQLKAWEGALARVPEEYDGWFLSPQFPTFRANDGRLDIRYFDWYCKQSMVWDGLREHARGMGARRDSVSPARFLSLKLPLPPLTEQRRTVERIEALAVKVEEARRLRREAEEGADVLMAGPLARMFGDPYSNSFGVLTKGDYRLLDEAVTDVADGPHVTPTYIEQGIPFVTVLNITSGRVNFAGAKSISEDDHRQFQRRAKAEPGDVLISKDGTIGMPCYVDTDREFSFFVSVALVKPKRDALDGRFLAWALRSPYLQERIRQRSRGDMIRHLVLREIRDLTVPVPPLSEQRRIVAYLDGLQGKVAAVQRLQGETGTELGALLPAVLARAFRGEL